MKYKSTLLILVISLSIFLVSCGTTTVTPEPQAPNLTSQPQTQAQPQTQTEGLEIVYESTNTNIKTTYYRDIVTDMMFISIESPNGYGFGITQFIDSTGRPLTYENYKYIKTFN